MSSDSSEYIGVKMQDENRNAEAILLPAKKTRNFTVQINFAADAYVVNTIEEINELLGKHCGELYVSTRQLLEDLVKLLGGIPNKGGC